MPNREDRPGQNLENLEQELDDDLLFGPVELAVAELERRGMDLKAIRARGNRIGHELQEKQRLAWRDSARQRLLRGRDFEPDDDEIPSDHASLVLLIEQARADPRFKQQLSMKFAGRRAAEANAEELAGLLREIRMLAKLLKDDPDDP